MKVLALTGGIASGKSTVAEALRARGGAILDADEVAREVVEPGNPALSAIVARFGPQALDAQGRLDRAWLGARVFADPQALADLNALVHPAVIDRLLSRLAELSVSATAPPFAVLMVPLLFETGMEGIAESVWVVALSEEAQLQRLMARDGLSLEAARQRIAAQMPLAEKLRRADRVIDNARGVEAIAPQVEAALRAEGLLG